MPGKNKSGQKGLRRKIGLPKLLLSKITEGENFVLMGGRGTNRKKRAGNGS